ncbi:MAG: NAD-glutamate dehydrogenase [Gammaproteobacteria bacterium]
MDQSATEKQLERLDSLVRRQISGADAELIRAFIRRYYQHVSTEDIETRPVDDLYGAALSHWNFAYARAAGETLVRVFNPNIEEHGWQSEHTVIEIVVEDMAFLVQTLIMEVNRHRLTNHVVIHPVYPVGRSSSGTINALGADGGTPEAQAEGFVHIEVDRQSDPQVLEDLKRGIENVLRHLRAATEDWHPILERLRGAIDQLESDHPESIAAEAEEALAFLRWLLDEHFVFLGASDYILIDDKRRRGIQPVAHSGLGVLRESIVPDPPSGLLPLSDDAWNILREVHPLLITKSTTLSTIHRPVFMDYIGVRRFDPSGKVIGETRFLGLYDSAAYSASPEQIPLLSAKVRKVFERSGFKPASHSGRALMHVLEDLPRDELYHSDEAALFDLAMGVLQLQERQRVRVFARQDVYGQYVSVLAFVPRERFHTELRKQIQSILLAAFDGKSSEFKVHLSESVLARIHFIIHTGQCGCLSYDLKRIEQKIVECLYDWKDEFKTNLLSCFGEEKGNLLFSRYGDGVGAAYREGFSPRIAVLDVSHLESLDATGLQLRLYRPLEMQGNRLRFKLYVRGEPVALSSILPMLENMGVRVLDEKPYALKRQDTGESVWIHDFGLIYEGQQTFEVDALKRKFQETFEQIWLGRVENDGFNRLVLFAQLEWRHLNILRALYFYLRQTGLAFSQAYVEDTLVNNPVIAILLVEYFDARFNPQFESREETLVRLEKLILAQIEEVASLDEDRILRQYLNLIQAMLRTNYYQDRADEKAIPYLSFKFNPEAIQDLPAPRPHFEIFVYSPRVEGVHLRAGPVARGGLRWSDRREDFRTEVLGLMKAQVSKNSVIVPTGAKGGFVAKRLDGLQPGDAADEVKNAYRVFIRGLLDLTDNICGNETVHPPQMIFYDGNDPYLVVAADKGTASFSDIANGIAKDYGFWLGDAFASGGSMGYDHKKMAITARGAWESVIHHFTELGIEFRTGSFSAVGVGDMSGDVFGNGMLLSRRIKLVGAFNHKDIFLDPDPDPEISFEERKRLFALPGSSWRDYDKTKLSKGGGVYPRDLKAIPLSSRVKKVFGVEQDKVTPNELIRIILRAPVDLLWNGGIGTYVKASSEQNNEVGDRSNDPLRVDARELRCKVVGEGGNLGFTQRGRLEFALNGGRINTDAIDNSAGVDCSDHEVNIKILLNRIVDDGDMTLKQRNQLLEKMTDEVASLVLRNNYLQTRAISYIQSRSGHLIDFYRRIISRLVQAGSLDRSLDRIPSDDLIDARKQDGSGFFRPEIAVLMASCKLYLKKGLIESPGLFESRFASSELCDYFPAALRKKFLAQIQNHPLRREIAANQLVNGMINRLGIVYPFRMMDETGAGVGDLVNAYCFTCEIFDLDGLWERIETLPADIDPEIRSDLQRSVNRLVERSMSWLAYNFRGQKASSEMLAPFKPGIEKLSSTMLEILPEHPRRKITTEIAALLVAGVAEESARRLSGLNVLFSFLDIIAVATRCGKVLDEVARIYFTLEERLRWGVIGNLIGGLQQGGYWSSLARTALYDDFHRACQSLTLDRAGSLSGSDSGTWDAWVQGRESGINRYLGLLDKVQTDPGAEIDALTVLIKELRSVANQPVSEAVV